MLFTHRRGRNSSSTKLSLLLRKEPQFRSKGCTLPKGALFRIPLDYNSISRSQDGIEDVIIALLVLPHLRLRMSDDH